MTDNNEQCLSAFREQCGKLVEQHKANCGLVYELYQRRLSASIDEYLVQLPDAYREEAETLARDEFYYMKQSEIDEAIEWDRENGFCGHGIERKCCPLGCGEF